MIQQLIIRLNASFEDFLRLAGSFLSIQCLGIPCSLCMARLLSLRVRSIAIRGDSCCTGSSDLLIRRCEVGHWCDQRGRSKAGAFYPPVRCSSTCALPHRWPAYTCSIWLLPKPMFRHRFHIYQCHGFMAPATVRGGRCPFIVDCNFRGTGSFGLSGLI